MTIYDDLKSKEDEIYAGYRKLKQIERIKAWAYRRKVRQMYPYLRLGAQMRFPVEEITLPYFDNGKPYKWEIFDIYEGNSGSIIVRIRSTFQRSDPLLNHTYTISAELANRLVKELQESSGITL